MQGSTKLAMAILVVFGSMVAFYFAFHPGGVANVKNPGDALQWLVKEFQATATAGGSGNASSPGSTSGTTA